MGRMMYCCQKTIQYPEKIKRKSMNRGLERTIAKFLAAWARLTVCASPERLGSLKNNSTAKNIRNTLNAATRNTFSTLRCWCTQEATYGPAALPTFTKV